MRLALTACAVLLAAAAPRDPAGRLLDALHAAPSEQQAAALEQQIEQVWRAAISPAVQLLEERALAALAHNDPRTAIGDLDAALDLQDDQALLWRLHAEARFANGDRRGAYADLAQALSREPRSFAAWSDLSQIAEEGGDYRRALEAWRHVLAIEPHAPHGAARAERLRTRVEGEAL